MSNPLAIRYRRLVLAEQNSDKARLLQLIADEADRGVLPTADWISTRQTKLTDAKSWTAEPASRFKAAHPGFIAPALATSITKVPSGVRWTHDIKFDGYRVQFTSESGGHRRYLAGTGLHGGKGYPGTDLDWPLTRR
jgi:ATP-dependent DNA ligase